jgi:uncharacterized peroxidase-related enzyme
VEHHGAGLLRASKSSDLLAALKAGTAPEQLPQRDRVMIEYATKLTRSPSSMTKSDVAAQQDSGFTDHEILEVNLAVAYMNLVNRIALGLGVELESDKGKFTR